MTTYSFVANSSRYSNNWDNPTVWNLDSVPNSTDATVIIPNSGFYSDITIAAAESFIANSVSIAANYLELRGALWVENAFVLSASSELNLTGGTLTTGSLQSGFNIQGNGQITSSGLIANVGEIIGTGLSLSSSSFQNTGSLIADGSSGAGIPSLTVITTGGAGSFAQSVRWHADWRKLRGHRRHARPEHWRHNRYRRSIPHS